MKTFRIIAIVSAIMFTLAACSNAESQRIEPAIMRSPPQFSIRVLLDDKAGKLTFRITNEYQIINFDTAEILKSTGTTNPIEITLDNNSVKVGREYFKTKRLMIQPQKFEPFIINESQAYRGNLEVDVNPDNKTMTVINNVSLETYLAGVIAAEMPSYWEIEALKAQTIAARTYCLYIKSKFGKNRLWDVKATQSNQVYKGVRIETIRTIDAVNSTAGIVMCSEQESGNCELFPAYYSSACGGHTENSENVFGDSYEPLKGVDCPYCRKSTRPSLFYWPEVIIDEDTVTKSICEKYPAIKDLGTIIKIEAAKESKYEKNFKRLTSVKLTGTTGKTAILRAEDLRLSLDPTGAKIQSASCTIVNINGAFHFISGNGFGHGVGLCQYGAREMARQGIGAEEILSHYYPNCRLKYLY